MGLVTKGVLARMGVCIETRAYLGRRPKSPYSQDQVYSIYHGCTIHPPRKLTSAPEEKNTVNGKWRSSLGENTDSPVKHRRGSLRRLHESILVSLRWRLKNEWLFIHSWGDGKGRYNGEEWRMELSDSCLVVVDLWWLSSLHWRMKRIVFTLRVNPSWWRWRYLLKPIPNSPFGLELLFSVV